MVLSVKKTKTLKTSYLGLFMYCNQGSSWPEEYSGLPTAMTGVKTMSVRNLMRKF